MPPAQAQTYQSRTSAAANGTRRPLSVPVPVSRAAEAQYDDEQWQRPPNAANMQHTVDFRRSWVPSPEMRGLFPLPAPGERRGTPSYAQGYVAGAHAHAQRPVMPPMARARQVHEGGDEEKREGGRMLHRQSQPQSYAQREEPPFFPRARPRAATVTGAAIGTSNGMGMGNETASRTHAGNGSARHSLHIPASTGRPRDQAPEAGQIWRSVRESQVQRGLHAAAEPGPAPERAGGLRANGTPTTGAEV
ncbi:hypothetical protein C8T65DRAFT_131627 [Cerioporus squamosus]|nr:hypothetical protein C8T65DRAFT_131627 [Cerioporus squamosus]